MPLTTKKTTLFFDMDGTLIDTEAPYFRAMQAACADYQVEMTAERYFSEYAGGTVAKARETLYRYVNDDQKAAKILAASDANYQQIVATEGIPLKPTAHQTLSQLEQQGYRLVIVSSSVRSVVEEMLNLTGIRAYFSLLVTGETVTHSKPHPEIFQQALQVAGVTAMETVIIEDSKQGIEAGYRAGIDTIMVPDYLAPDEQTRQFATAVVPQLSDILPLLQ